VAKALSVREARAAFATVVNEVAFGKERFVITRNGKRAVAIVPVEDLDTIETIEDKIDLAEVRKRLAKPGKTMTVAELRKSLGV
jgi:prevent-host-death family protein